MCRHFTAQVAGMENMDYWERLSSMKIYSQERRRERYSIIVVWKISQGLVKGYKVNFDQNPRRQWQWYILLHHMMLQLQLGMPGRHHSR